jgi:hypothetical protein
MRDMARRRDARNTRSDTGEVGAPVIASDAGSVSGTSRLMIVRRSRSRRSLCLTANRQQGVFELCVDRQLVAGKEIDGVCRES